jgi:surface polysaccharide O-acyltransferase-like enzyme
MALTRVCVPLFFMVSGALLLGRDDDWRDYLRRLTRIVVPTVVFGVVYFAWAAR